MAKKSQKQIVLNALTPKRLIAVGLILAIVAATAYWINVRYIEKYNRAADQAAMVSVRELVLQAAKGINSPVVLEPKSGDAYIPEAKLYLPTAEGVNKLTYNFSAKTSDWPEEIHISSSLLIGQSSAKLYSAQDINQLFAVIPELQACQRGIRLYYEPPKELDDSLTLEETLTLNNGRKMSVYTEKACPDLKDLLPIIKTIHSY